MLSGDSNGRESFLSYLPFIMLYTVKLICELSGIIVEV